MISPKLLPLVVKQVWRHRTRSLLTMSGVAVAMFLFISVQSLQRGVQQATSESAADQTLIVYRENRFCPAASRLPEFYHQRIAKVPGVAEVIPMKIVVNNCRAALDVVTFRGVPQNDVASISRDWKVRSGSLAQFDARSDSAIVGELLAGRRRLSVGDSFDSSGVTVNVAAIIRSPHAQDQNVAYVHLPFLQQAADTGLGTVTQFNVRVSDPMRMREVAEAIDDEFRSEADPTSTKPEKAFVAQAGHDIIEIVKFTQLLGWGCLAAILALVANAIILSVQDRVREHAVFQTLGFRSNLIARLIVCEGALLGLFGALAGTAIAFGLVRYGKFSISTEGLSVNVTADAHVVITGLLIALTVGVLAGLVPAIQASRREIAHCFRAV